MEITDYYAESVSRDIAYSVGKGARYVKVAVQNINPLKAIGAVMLVWGGIAGLVNLRKYKKGKITKKQAITVTTSESVGMGLAAGLGLLADGILKTYILATTVPTVFPFVVGVAVTAGTKITWDCKTKHSMAWCESKGSQKDRKELTPAMATA